MRILLATAAAVLGCAAPAAAATPAGSLTQLPGKAGCFVDPTSYVAVNGCAKARAMKSPQTVVLSPDGRFAYTPSNSAQAISAFRVGAGGRLTQLAGTAGCYSSVTAGCTKAVQTVWAFGIAMPPDGRSLYLTTTFPTNTLDQFSRNPSAGTLAPLAGADACLGRQKACTNTDGLNQPRGVVFSPDGRFAYATAFSGNGVTAFSRDAGTGRLTPAACVKQGTAAKTCAGARDLDGATDVDVSADGRFVYVTSFRGDAITAFARDAATGALTELGCLAQGGKDGCTAARGLDGAYDLALSPDGRHVYVASRFSRAVAILARRPDGSLGQGAGRLGCVSEGGKDGCRASTRASLHGVRGVAVSPDGRNVYTGAFSSSALSIFSRDPATGALRQRGCIADREPHKKILTPGCTPGRGLHQAWGIAIARNGRTLYIGSGGDGNSGLAIFRRSVPG
jgi:6-phosphogluconolactonase (cycloisomerase 2 family)